MNIKFLSEPYTTCMEKHNSFGCYLSLKISSKDFESGIREFYEDHHFIIAFNMFDPEWDEKLQLEAISKKLILIYHFNPSDENLIIVYKNHKKVYLPNNKHVVLPPGSIFVYDKSKIKISY